jgi:malic enzyme
LKNELYSKRQRRQVAAYQSGDRSPHSKYELQPEYIIPSVFDKRVAEASAHAVEEAAYQTGVARRDRNAQDEM